MPERIEPMLAALGRRSRATTASWAYEIKWDGVRAIGYVDGGRLRLESRNGNDITPRYPELRALGRALGTREAMLDGEVVAFDGRPAELPAPAGRACTSTSERAVRRLVAVRAGRLHDLRPAVPRRALADGRCPTRSAARSCSSSASTAPTWQTPAHHVGDGAALLEASRAQGLEGIVAKRLDCPYAPGRRSSGWVKVKNVRRADVGGRRLAAGRGRPLGPPRRARGRLLRGRRAALRRPRRHRLHRGRARAARHAARRRSRATTARSTGRQPPKGTRFVEPRARRARSSTASVTERGTLRQPAYKGLRDDVAPEDVGPPDEV